MELLHILDLEAGLLHNLDLEVELLHILDLEAELHHNLDLVAELLHILDLEDGLHHNHGFEVELLHMLDWEVEHFHIDQVAVAWQVLHCSFDPDILQVMGLIQDKHQVEHLILVLGILLLDNLTY